MKNFTIVEFSDSAMEVVPSSWVDRSTGAILCYWTAHNVRAQVSACHLPNKSWAKYAVKKIWLCTDSYDKAMKKCRRLMDTSSIETEDDASVHKRQCKRPRRFMTDSSSDDESVPQMRKSVRTECVSGSPVCPQLPPPPAYESTPHRKPAGRPELDGSIMTQAEAELITQREVRHHTEGGGSAMETEMRAMWTSITRMAQRMEKMEQRLDEVLMLLRSSQSQSPPSAPVDDMLLSPCSTVTELEEFDRSLGQQERREKMQLFLTTLGGSTRGTAIRRMLRRVATNDVLKQFSLRGRKAKKAFQDLTICRVITAAFQKNFPGVTAAETEDLIGQVLKFAPHRRPAEKD
ncbi:hypothetical protein R3I94_013920 [Phoxinus phoxinus]